MRRLFSTFANGWPGAGLLLIRLVCGGVSVARVAGGLHHELSVAAIAALLAVIAGLFLVVGLWTPIAGSVVAVLGILFALTDAENPLANVLIAAMGAALVLVGPGAWSIDRRLFGWKRIDVRERSR